MKTRHPGEVWLADLGLAAKPRPVLILSRADSDPPRVLFLYAPITSQYRGSGYEVELGKLPFLNLTSAVNLQGIGSLPEPRFGRKLEAVSAEKLEEIRQAIIFTFGLDCGPQSAEGEKLP